MEEREQLKCPHCGWAYCPDDYKDDSSEGMCRLVPYHSWPYPTKQCCPGSKQHPRSMADRRSLWKDLDEQ